MPDRENYVNNICALINAQDFTSSINLLLLSLIHVIVPGIFKNNQIAMNSFLSEVDSRRISILDGYIYCSRKLHKLPKKDENAEAIKKMLLELKIRASNATNMDIGNIPADWTQVLLFSNPYGLNYVEWLNVS